MGKKYIIELLDDCPSEFKGIIVFGLTPNGQISAEPIPVEDLPPYTEPDIEQVRKDTYEKGINDAWEAARTLWNTEKRKEIFGYNTFNTVITTLTGQEALEKIRQYEQRQEEQIQVGDEVTPRETEYDDMIVTRLWKDDYDSDCIDAIGFDGRIGSFLVSRVSKTGKHYEIAAVLEKMREGQE